MTEGHLLFRAECLVDRSVLEGGLWYKYYIGDDAEYIEGEENYQYCDRWLKVHPAKGRHLDLKSAQSLN